MNIKEFWQEYKEIKEFLYLKYSFISQVERKRIKEKEEAEKNGNNNV